MHDCIVWKLYSNLIIIIFLVQIHSSKDNFRIYNYRSSIDYFNILILSELLILISLFWTYYQGNLATLLLTTTNDVTLYDLCLENIVILILAALLLSLNIFNSSITLIILTLILGLLFLNGQYNEFANICIYINDTFYSNIMYTLDGYHMFHVIIGSILILIYNTNIFNYLILIYWHLVEILWIFIYLIIL